MDRIFRRGGRRRDVPSHVKSGLSSPRGLRRALLSRRNRRAIAACEASAVQGQRMGAVSATCVALAVLVFALGIALGEMYAGGAVIHAVVPSRHFDILYALHNQLVVGILIGLSLVWLAPPHRWVARLVEPPDKQPAPTADKRESGKVANLTARTAADDRASLRRMRTKQEIG